MEIDHDFAWCACGFVPVRLRANVCPSLEEEVSEVVVRGDFVDAFVPPLDRLQLAPVQAVFNEAPEEPELPLVLVRLLDPLSRLDARLLHQLEASLHQIALLNEQAQFAVCVLLAPLRKLDGQLHGLGAEPLALASRLLLRQLVQVNGRLKAGLALLTDGTE